MSGHSTIDFEEVFKGDGLDSNIGITRYDATLLPRTIITSPMLQNDKIKGLNYHNELGQDPITIAEYDTI